MEELKQEISSLRQELQEVKQLQQSILDRLCMRSSLISALTAESPLPATHQQYQLAGFRSNSSSAISNADAVAFVDDHINDPIIPNRNSMNISSPLPVPYPPSPNNLIVENGFSSPDGQDKRHSIHRVQVPKESPSTLNLGSLYNLAPIISYRSSEKIISKAMSNWDVKKETKDGSFRLRLCMWQECFELFCQVIVNDVDAVIDLQFRAERGDLSALAYLMVLYGCGMGPIGLDPVRVEEIAAKIFPTLQAYDNTRTNNTNVNVVSDAEVAKIIDPADLPHAYFVLAHCYERGWGLPATADPKELHNRLTQSITYLRGAARRGHAGAQNHLGHFYEIGLYVSSSGKKVLPQSHSQVNVMTGEVGDSNDAGTMPLGEVIVPQIISEAIRWFVLSADQGYVIAFHNLGHCHAKEGHHLQALKYYQRAAERGYLPSIAELRS